MVLKRPVFPTSEAWGRWTAVVRSLEWIAEKVSSVSGVPTWRGTSWWSSTWHAAWGWAAWTSGSRAWWWTSRASWSVSARRRATWAAGSVTTWWWTAGTAWSLSLWGWATTHVHVRVSLVHWRTSSLHLLWRRLLEASCSLSAHGLSTLLCIKGSLLPLHSVSLQKLSQLSIVHGGGGSDIRVSLQNLK